MEERERKMYDFTCSSCGDVDQVPFEPDRELRCKECMRAEREIRQRKAPRRKHNTRVSMPINCAECGKREVLDYIPKGKNAIQIYRGYLIETCPHTGRRFNIATGETVDANDS